MCNHKHQDQSRHSMPAWAATLIGAPVGCALAYGILAAAAWLCDLP